jgi:hypothetical protein
MEITGTMERRGERMQEDRQAAKAMVNATFAIAECIRELGEIPSGHLYANVMGRMSLDYYQGIIDVLKRTKLVEEKGNLLKWIGPRLETAGKES